MLDELQFSGFQKQRTKSGQSKLNIPSLKVSVNEPLSEAVSHSVPGRDAFASSRIGIYRVFHSLGPSTCTDFLRFFLDLPRPEVNERDIHNYEICGNITMIQKTHYSSTRALILEFHSDKVQGNNTGFRGIFKFLDKEMTGSLTNGRVDCLQITGRSHGWTTDNPAVLIPERELTVQRNHSHTDS
ncbi:hypothetical protein LSH36_710g00019 [Paralvinella palmiformis]|uniref:Uncharacterized protein n=1 Tax=Paralvinella palmiformis TaxID=53620 RepID=A0AAD9J289_9ANNE|nr:hypothetical protein LSH36_710g00019 [Paralvinella palmiformis]